MSNYGQVAGTGESPAYDGVSQDCFESTEAMQAALASRGAAPAAPAGPSRRDGHGPARRATPSVSGVASAPGAGSRGQFRIHFRGERMIQARDIREALRQAESLGATEVTAVTRAD